MASTGGLPPSRLHLALPPAALPAHIGMQINRLTGLTSLEIEAPAERMGDLFLGLPALKELKIHYRGPGPATPLGLAEGVELTYLRFAPASDVAPISEVVPFIQQVYCRRADQRARTRESSGRPRRVAAASRAYLA